MPTPPLPLPTLRPLYLIAQEICRAWAVPNYAARPYLNAMLTLEDMTDTYGADSAESIVLYFLSNASTFRGPQARALKQCLKDHLATIKRN